MYIFASENFPCTVWACPSLKTALENPTLSKTKKLATLFFHSLMVYPIPFLLADGIYNFYFLGKKLCQYLFSFSSDTRSLPIKPQYPVQIKSRDLYLQLKSNFLKFDPDTLSHIGFDDQKSTITFRFDYGTLRDLAWAREPFTQIFGNRTELSASQEAQFHFSIESLQKKAERLLKKAQTYFAETIFPPKIQVSWDSNTSHKNLNTEEFLKAIIAKSQGLCIGESHGHSAPKYFLCKYMSLFKSLGITMIFIEGLTTEMQEDLDGYCANSSASLPSYLEAASNRESRQFISQPNRYTLADVILAAKKEGTRIVALESEATAFSSQATHDFTGCREEAQKGRLHIVNYQGKLIIDREKGNGKHIIFSGLSHIQDNSPVPSFSRIYGYPSLYIHDFRVWDAFKAETPSVDPPHIQFDSQPILKDLSNGSVDFAIGMQAPIKC